MRIATIPITVVLCVCLTGCLGAGPDDEQLLGWKSDVSALRADIRENEAVLETIQDPVKRASLIAANRAIEKRVIIIDDAIQGALDSDDAKGAMWDATLKIAGGFFPPLLLLGPWVKALRRQRKTIFRAVDAGGGVLRLEDAKKVLTEDKQAHAALQKYQKANGNG